MGRTEEDTGTELTIPEVKRRCRNCDGPAGRSRAGRPGRATGYCTVCGHPFSFVPPLEPGDVVNNQYEILRCLALGGLGWVYLATDRMVSDRLVVLKGMIDSTDPAKVQLSIAERQFLAGVNHPNIVRIHNFVYHDAGHGDRSGYIVMEYIEGQSLKDILMHRWAASGRYDPLPLEHALGYVLDILPAFSYLHSLGLLYCDFKPDNVIDAGDRLILVDLGAVRGIDDDKSDYYGTRGYQAPEVADRHPPTIDSDLYTVGRTLAVLSMRFAHQTTYERSLPPREEVPLLRDNESFYRLLARAAAPDPAHRFSSAEELYDQVLGVLRETLAANGSPQPGSSRLFTGERRIRVTPARDVAGPDGHELPTPRVEPTDPAKTYLDAITVHDPDALLALLDRAPERTVEVEYEALRAELRAAATTPDALAAARARLERIGRTYDGPDWRRAWFTGVIELADGQPERARSVFDRLYDLMPGELAVKLALAMSEELAGRPAQAADRYDTVCRTDPSFTTACTGLARCRLALGDHRGAVEAYQRVPVTSAAYRVAQVDALHALLRHGGPEAARVVEPDDLRDAAALTGALGGPPAERAQLRAVLLEAALDSVCSGGAVPATDLGVDDPSESGIRTALEGCYRMMASYARGMERVRLVDQANAIRPWTRI